MTKNTLFKNTLLKKKTTFQLLKIKSIAIFLAVICCCSAAESHSDLIALCQNNAYLLWKKLGVIKTPQKSTALMHPNGFWSITPDKCFTTARSQHLRSSSSCLHVVRYIRRLVTQFSEEGRNKQGERLYRAAIWLFVLLYRKNIMAVLLHSSPLKVLPTSI